MIKDSQDMQLEVVYNNDTFLVIITHYLNVPPDHLNDVSDWDHNGYTEIGWEFVDIELDYLYSHSQKDEIEKLIIEDSQND